MALPFLQVCVRHSWPGAGLAFIKQQAPARSAPPRRYLQPPSRSTIHTKFLHTRPSTHLSQTQPFINSPPSNPRCKSCRYILLKCTIRPTVCKALFLSLLTLSSVKARFQAKITVTAINRYLGRPSAEQAVKIKARCSSLFLKHEGRAEIDD